MNNQADANNQINPIYSDRKDKIVLSIDIICGRCGRTKERAHCPCCGKIKLRGLAPTVFAQIPETNEIVKDCKTYRCDGCSEKFNDVDWYFSCHAPVKVDWKATKELQRKRSLKEWIDVIKSSGRLGHNERLQFKKETGRDAREVEDQIIRAIRFQSKTKVPMTPRETIVELKDRIENIQAALADGAMKTSEDIEDALNQIKGYEDQIAQIEKLLRENGE